MTTESETFTHEYLSTSCLHDKHEYCQSFFGEDTTGQPFTKVPGQCKFCYASCICACHVPALMDPMTQGEWDMVRGVRKMQNE